MSRTPAPPRTALPPEVLMDTVLRVADRLASTERVAEAMRRATDAGAPPWHWRPHGTAAGFAGLALFFGCLDACRPGEGWDGVAHRHLAAAVDAAQRAGPLPLGLAEGVSGLAFTALCLDGDGTRYRRLRRTLDQRLTEQLPPLLAHLRSATGPGPYDLDVISGAAGITAYLTARPGSDELSDLRDELLDALAACVHRGRLPRRPATGGLDCGLAHGLPGPVAALALARLHGLPETGPVRAAALRTGTDRLLAHRTDDRWGPNWPGDDTTTVPAHAAWCYGAPGVARSLLLAGRALDDTTLLRAGLDAFRAISERPDEERRLTAPGFCHGTAGLAHLLRVTAAEEGGGAGGPGGRAAGEAGRLLAQGVAGFEPGSCFGYRNPHLGPAGVDSPGLLDGAAGVAVVLLSAADRRAPRWDRLFLVR